jgi:pantetheine-phosphate adenylyltransferase
MYSRRPRTRRFAPETASILARAKTLGETPRAAQPGVKCPDGSSSMKTSIAIYPGSFDPVTNGHLDLIERGEKMFDLVIVAVLNNAEKRPLFTVPERVEMLREVTQKWSGVEVDVFHGLLVDYARKRGAGVILRGIRAISDYEYELQMALMNRKLEPRLETVFMLPGETYSYLSSKLVREIAQLGGPLKDLVPPAVEQRLRAKVL